MVNAMLILRCLSQSMKTIGILTIFHAWNELAITNHKGKLPTSSTHIKVLIQSSDDSSKIFELSKT